MSSTRTPGPQPPPPTGATGPSTSDPAAAEAVFLPATLSLLTSLSATTGDVVADIGPGAGSATVALARAVGENGRVYAVDHDPAMLDEVLRSAHEAGVADRVRLVSHDLEDGPPALPEPVDAVWSSACVHHTRDWGATVTGLAGLLRPGGVLCLGEGGLPTRCLPWDVGVGRPGPEVRLDEAHNRWFADWFGQQRQPKGWVDLLADAGLVGITSRSALVDVPAPLPEPVRAVVLEEFAARVDRARAYLDGEDTATWARLLNPADAAWLGHRTDLALLTARTAHWGRSRPGRRGPSRVPPNG
ncbi:class I SAM-dependent methyltransferase [Saccharothrix xinjiangensis]|uniref:Class I SAM-dependent methyltransferase n=1 Tax=Saccharothrix xinjiangensis TaxID=204798 RepID=A0ABV9Y261_9PSEU